ncbi:MAG: LPS-assembly protein LptD [Dysgonamonadaceae bacterium]|jgi:hypothetical protein|nr:LPS-assembly protein LptD [Dysgonamonadaceae bacterium]
MTQDVVTQRVITDDILPKNKISTLLEDTVYQLLKDTVPQLLEDTVPQLFEDTVYRLPENIPPVLAADTVAAKDSIKTNAIDAPVQYAAKDSMVMIMEGHNMLYLYNEASVKYKNMDLTGAYVEVDADRNAIYASHVSDSTGNESGYPVFKEGESQYEMKKVRYNFKTKKMFVWDVITQQGEGYVTATVTKKMPNDELFMCDGRYTTCDEHDHPHFYFHMTKAKVRPGKDIMFGPTYLVIEDVPLPLALPFGFFPFTNSNYASGIIMPSYGDELTRGFSLRDGGYYFAFSDYIDLALRGEIYTKGSWGIDARSSYRKRYKYSGNFNAAYLVTIIGDKESPDYSKSKDFKLTWSHSQDAKANPFSTLSASVNFSTSSYNRNSLGSIYSNQYSQNTKSSSINYSYRPPGSVFSFSANVSVNQVSRDTSLSVTLPNFTANMRDIYPFKRKEQVGAPRWYENIRMSYSGLLANSITAKEYNFFEKNLIRDWRNGIKHDIPISASFNLFKVITISPSISYSERWYSSRIEKGYDYIQNRVVNTDTVYGFNRVYNYSGGITANTKLYGMFKPWSIFGKKMQKVQIRHVFTPSVGFTGAPDFSDKLYGFYKDLIYYNRQTGKNDTVSYSPYETGLWGAPGRGKTGSMSFSIENNLEMKVPIGATDSTRKISLIDNLRMSMSYNFLADSMNWSDLSTSLRLKFTKSLNFNIQAQFDTYTYNENGTRINVPRWKAGKGIGRLRSTGWSFSYSLNNTLIKNLFSKKEKDSSTSQPPPETDTESSEATETGENLNRERTSLRKPKEKNGDFDADGYFLSDLVWSLNFNYSLTVGYDMSRDKFNKETREYPYRINQLLDFSGNLSPTKNWALNFSTSYDFDLKKISNLYLSITRQMHCWSMTASIRPIGPMQSYTFSIAVNSSLLKDLKYDQSSNSRDATYWGNEY